jgi:hypothetical protein
MKHAWKNASTIGLVSAVHRLLWAFSNRFPVPAATISVNHALSVVP